MNGIKEKMDREMGMGKKETKDELVRIASWVSRDKTEHTCV